MQIVNVQLSDIYAITRTSPQQRLDTGNQFNQRKRFRQIVVRTLTQTLDTFINRTASR
ncbi:hypothetical protein D3C81_2205930 [compost metagenome]